MRLRTRVLGSVCLFINKENRPSSLACHTAFSIYIGTGKVYTIRLSGSEVEETVLSLISVVAIDDIIYAWFKQILLATYF